MKGRSWLDAIIKWTTRGKNSLDLSLRFSKTLLRSYMLAQEQCCGWAYARGLKIKRQKYLIRLKFLPERPEFFPQVCVSRKVQHALLSPVFLVDNQQCTDPTRPRLKHPTSARTMRTCSSKSTSTRLTIAGKSRLAPAQLDKSNFSRSFLF